MVQRVALKIIKPGMDSREVIAAFRRRSKQRGLALHLFERDGLAIGEDRLRIARCLIEHIRIVERAIDTPGSIERLDQSALAALPRAVRTTAGIARSRISRARAAARGSGDPFTV